MPGIGTVPDANVFRQASEAWTPSDAERVSGRSRGLNLSTVYAAALVIWLATRWLVLVHQGAWPWMNAFVVAAARGIVVGDWNEAVRPQLPAVLGIPLVLAGANEQQTVAALYVMASLVQFAAFVALIRAVFPSRLLEQSLGLLVFLVVPFNHSIHHYRDVPVVLASSAVFLLAALFITAFRPGRSAFGIQQVVWVFAAMLLGVWSRTEVLTFVAVLVVLGLALWRRRAIPVALAYAAAAIVVSGGLLVANRLEGIDPAEASRYQVHTFLDSTPESWLTPACRADPTENCRADDGLLYFGPVDPQGGVLAMVLSHPLTTVAKTVRSAWDNLWILLGPNLSTFPGIVPFLILALVVFRPSRDLLAHLPAAVWIAIVAVIAETVLPPLSWAPPHPQYHLQLVFPVVAVTVAVLVGLARMPRGRLLILAFFIGNAGLSIFRYTRYPGY
jgi:hypothetical protein